MKITFDAFDAQDSFTADQYIIKTYADGTYDVIGSISRSKLYFDSNLAREKGLAPQWKKNDKLNVCEYEVTIDKEYTETGKEVRKSFKIIGAYVSKEPLWFQRSTIVNTDRTRNVFTNARAAHAAAKQFVRSMFE